MVLLCTVTNSYWTVQLYTKLINYVDAQAAFYKKNSLPEALEHIKSFPKKQNKTELEWITTMAKLSQISARMQMVNFLIVAFVAWKADDGVEHKGNGCRQVRIFKQLLLPRERR